MTDPEALEEAVRRTGHARFRELLDPSHPSYSPSYWPAVRRLAGAEPPLPSLARQAANFAAAVVMHAAAGFPRATPETVEARLAVCQGCDRLRDDGRCSACGCGVQVKAELAGQKCPLGKW